MSDQVPDFLTGTELAMVAEVPAAGGRWQQVHFNIDVTRQFFGLTSGLDRAIHLQRINPAGLIDRQHTGRLVFSEFNRNSRIEFDFSPLPDYPSSGLRPILVIVEAAPSTYRYRFLMPGDPGYSQMTDLLASGPQVGKGVRRRIVTLDEVSSFWPESKLRGAIS